MGMKGKIALGAVVGVVVIGVVSANAGDNNSGSASGSNSGEHSSASAQHGSGGGKAQSAEKKKAAFAEWDLGEFALLAQPGLDLGEGEGRARLGAADGLGEVGVPTAPVAHGRAADAGQPRDPGGGHLGRVVLHSPRPSRPDSPLCDAEHTDAGKICPFTPRAQDIA